MKKITILILFLFVSVSSADSNAYRFVNVGDPYPPFCAEQFRGIRVCSDSYDNRIVVISFFSLNQTASQKVLRDLQEVYVKLTGKNVSVLGILSEDADPQMIEAFLTENKITFPILLDKDRQIYGSFGVFVYPSTGIFSEDKKLRYYLPSEKVNYKECIERYVRFLLKEISESELEAIIHPAADYTASNVKQAENYYNFAKIYFDRGKFDKATKLLDSALAANSHYALAYSLYGYLHIQRQEYQLGLEKFKFALGIDPNLEEAQKGMQICLDNLNK